MDISINDRHMSNIWPRPKWAKHKYSGKITFLRDYSSLKYNVNIKSKLTESTLIPVFRRFLHVVKRKKKDHYKTKRV